VAPLQYATLLAKAKQALSDILDGRSEEVQSLSYRQRMLRIEDLRKNIEWLEQQAAIESGWTAVRPIRSVRV
jgi:hypothetical protein